MFPENMLLFTVLLAAISASALHLNMSIKEDVEKKIVKEVVAQTVEDEIWDSWKLTYKKEYISVAEETYRKEIFQRNKKEIDELNKPFKAGDEHYTNNNKFADLTHQEFLDSCCGMIYDYDYDYETDGEVITFKNDDMP